MAEMLIQPTVVSKVVFDYDIIFSMGPGMALTIDPEAGDTIEQTTGQILVHLAEKPSPNDPDKTLPAEDTTIFLAHVIAIQRRERVVVEPTPEEKFAWAEAFSTLVSNSIQ